MVNRIEPVFLSPKLSRDNNVFLKFPTQSTVAKTQRSLTILADYCETKKKQQQLLRKKSDKEFSDIFFRLKSFADRATLQDFLSPQKVISQARLICVNTFTCLFFLYFQCVLASKLHQHQLFSFLKH